MKDFTTIAAMSYFLGSIPFGYLLVRTFRGADVRQSGSGNIGATNVARSSPVLGVLTLGLDALKGFAAVAITRALFPGNTLLAGVAAVCAIIGHVFPVWLHFRGGKGVATGLGSFAILTPKSILVMICIFTGIVLLCRHVSVGSIVVVILFPLLAGLLDGYGKTPQVLALIGAGSLLILIKHRENIRRLIKGTEPRFELRRR